MVVKKKRTAEEANLNQDSSPSSEELRELCRLVKSEVVIELAHLKQLKTLLKRMSKEEDGEKSVNSIVDTSVLTSLLSSFGALRTENDNKIYDILERLERKFKVNLGPLQPLVWGPQAKEHYQKLSSLGSSLHRISSNDVLSYLKPATTWNTVKNHSRPEQFDTYNTRFIMQLFAYLLQPGSEVSCPKFIKENCLSLVFSCLSSKNEATRVLAYYNLQRFLSLLLELKEERFNEKALFIYVVRLFKQSLPTSAPRISHLVSHFFARVSKLILHPEDPVYGQIVAFLCQKPQIDLRNVPEFYKLLLSTSVEYYKQEREWILVLIAEAIIDPFDYAVLQNRSGVKLLLSLFNSCVLDQPCRKSILGILKASAKIPSAAYDLVHRCNIHAWIALTIKNAKLTRWERNYLAQIFLILLNNEKTIREQKTDRDASAAVGTMTKLASKTVVSVMRELLATESEVVSNQRLEEIEAFFQE